jgi:hypothetical protein
MTEDRIAPDGMTWVCCACGKTAKDRYGIEGERSPGWDEGCMMNAFLAEEVTLVRGPDGRVAEIKK